MYKYLNKALFDLEKQHYIKDTVRYGSYSELIEDKRVVPRRTSDELKGKFFASTSEDAVLAQHIRKHTKGSK